MSTQHAAITICLMLAASTFARAGAAANVDAPPTADRQAAMAVYVGCVVEETAFARAAGLGRIPDPAAAAVQLVLLRGEGGLRDAYTLTGTRERDAAPFAGRRVELRATLESAAVAPPTPETPRSLEPGIPANGASGVTPRGNPAHEPGDAAPAIATPAAPDGSEPAAGSRGIDPATVAELPRLNVIGVRPIEGPCPDLPLPARETRIAPEAPAPQPRRSAVSQPDSGTAPAGPVTVTGCLVRLSETGSAQSPAAADAGVLAITRATVPGTAPPRGTAVPGSAPSGGGSGTVGTAGTARVDAPLREDAAFFVEGGGAALAANVGRRVTITGTVRAQDAGREARADAHATAPSGTLVVQSFSASNGACR